MHKKTKENHQTHEDILLRLKRARGHLDSVIEMIEKEESCVKVSRQMHAVGKAINEAKRLFIQDHIEHCLDEDALNASEMNLKEFKEITKYL